MKADKDRDARDRELDRQIAAGRKRKPRTKRQEREAHEAQERAFRKLGY